jgi:hypothetical protein
MKSPRSLLLACALGLAATASLSGTALAQQPNPEQCFSKYHVVNPDHIGKLQLPAGIYQIQTNSATDILSCSRAAYLFTEFLNDFDGVLPRPWRMEVAGTGNALFKRGAGQSFSAVFIGPYDPAQPVSPTTGGGTHGTGACPGTFSVLHNDRVGALRIPKARYTITTLGGRLSCKAASALFARFLQSPNGKLRGGWIVLPQTGEFVRGSSNYGFQIKPAA